jgi:hypothetical protein
MIPKECLSDNKASTKFPALLIWLVLVALLSSMIAVRSAQAQCAGGNNQRGRLQTDICYFGWDCSGGYGEVCEKSVCGGTCGPGYFNFCVISYYCHMYPACYNEDCG